MQQIRFFSSKTLHIYNDNILYNIGQGFERSFFSYRYKRRILSAISAINSELVGFPFPVLMV